MFFQKCLNALEIHILRNMAPNWMKQILLCSLGIDLQFKNIVCKFCDTFCIGLYLVLVNVVFLENA
jgi:hypothetical protein